MKPNPPIPSASPFALDIRAHPLSSLAQSPTEWRSVFYESFDALKHFLPPRNPIPLLARCATLASTNESHKSNNPEWFSKDYGLHLLIGFPEVEFLQALSLTQHPWNTIVPTSPANTDRLISYVTKCSYAFLRKNKRVYLNEPEKEDLIQKVRLQTIHYRNLFHQKDCETAVTSLLRRIDNLAFDEFGFAFSEMFISMIGIYSKISERFSLFHDRVKKAIDCSSEREVLTQADFFCSISPAAKRAWSICRRRCTTLQDLRMASFQLSELSHDWIYTIGVDEVRQEFGDEAVSFLRLISFKPGDLEKANPEHFLMNNPIWSRPFINLYDSKFFLPLPVLLYSFPLRVFERLMSQSSALEDAYSEARSHFLEDMIKSQIQVGMPSARVYANVRWRDETSGATYENDVITLIGNTIFLFEAKSGRLDDVARRGGELSLQQNFRDLFVAPGEQARRLERYLNTKRGNAKFWIKGSDKAVHLDLATPKVVHRFSICLEHFAALTSAKHYLKVLGVMKDDEAWSPVLSLGELMLVCRRLDTEVSFFHYLTRRASLEEVLDFEGDEQDILSMYLTNGLCLDQRNLKGQKIYFMGFDRKAREDKEPRNDRTRFETLGISLPSYWKRTAREIYFTKSLTHRFDILQVILNQQPEALLGLLQQGKRWVRGLDRKKGDVFMVERKIGKRTFVLAYHVARRAPTTKQWTQLARGIAGTASERLEASDCTVLLRVKGSRERYFDAVSFFRLASPNYS